MEYKHVFGVFVENYNDCFLFIYFCYKKSTIRIQEISIAHENLVVLCIFYIEHKKTFCIVTTIDQFFNLQHTYYHPTLKNHTYIWMSNLKSMEFFLWLSSVNVIMVIPFCLVFFLLFTWFNYLFLTCSSYLLFNLFVTYCYFQICLAWSSLFV